MKGKFERKTKITTTPYHYHSRPTSQPAPGSRGSAAGLLAGGFCEECVRWVVRTPHTKCSNVCSKRLALLPGRPRADSATHFGSPVPHIRFPLLLLLWEEHSPTGPWLQGDAHCHKHCRKHHEPQAPCSADLSLGCTGSLAEPPQARNHSLAEA